MVRDELFLKTAFCCMACDGVVATEEVDKLRSIVSEMTLVDSNIETVIDKYVDGINSNASKFIDDFLHDLKSAELDEANSLELIKIAVDVIESDNDVAYSEIKFFKQVRNCLKISDEKILSIYPEIEDYLLPDIMSKTDFDWDSIIQNIKVEIIN